MVIVDVDYVMLCLISFRSLAVAEVKSHNHNKGLKNLRLDSDDDHDDRMKNFLLKSPQASIRIGFHFTIKVNASIVYDFMIPIKISLPFFFLRWRRSNYIRTSLINYPFK